MILILLMVLTEDILEIFNSIIISCKNSWKTFEDNIQKHQIK